MAFKTLVLEDGVAKSTCKHAERSHDDLTEELQDRICLDFVLNGARLVVRALAHVVGAIVSELIFGWSSLIHVVSSTGKKFSWWEVRHALLTFFPFNEDLPSSSFVTEERTFEDLVFFAR